jgi:hypothetical protein
MHGHTYLKLVDVILNTPHTLTMCNIADQYTGVLISPRRKETTATEDLSFIYPIYNHNWRNISTIYIYKTSIKRNILTIKKKKVLSTIVLMLDVITS